MTIRHVIFVAVSHDDRRRKGTERKRVSGLNWPHLLRVSNGSKKIEEEREERERNSKGKEKDRKRTEYVVEEEGKRNRRGREGLARAIFTEVV